MNAKRFLFSGQTNLATYFKLLVRLYNYKRKDSRKNCECSFVRNVTLPINDLVEGHSAVSVNES